MTRILNLVADARRFTYGSMADQLNFLSEDAPLGAAELKMSLDLSGITPGMVLSSGLNVYYVTNVIPAEKKIVVYPTYDNSRSDALPVGSPVMIRPRVTDWHLFNLLNNAITLMSSSTSGLYKEGSWVVQSTGFTWNTYDIPLDAQDMTALTRVSMRWRGSDPAAWYEIPPNSVKWQPGNNVIRLTSDCAMGMEMKFDYKAPFREAVSLTDDVEFDLGLAATMTDIPPLGAAAALLRTTESRRGNIHAQGDPRRADEVAAGSNTSAAREMQRRFEDRIGDEYIRLVNRNPLRQSL